jgi:SHS2 domain-containing protein
MDKSLHSKPTQGYREVEHTADWELLVWAADLPGLLEQAARGMYALSGVDLEGKNQVIQTVHITAIDSEMALVGFLQELLFLAETQGIGFHDFTINLQQDELFAKMSGAKIAKISKEIKAVTFHNLKVESTPSGLQARIVFDV